MSRILSFIILAVFALGLTSPIKAQTQIEMHRSNVWCHGRFYYIAERYNAATDRTIINSSANDAPFRGLNINSNIACWRDTHLVLLGENSDQQYGLYAIALSTQTVQFLTGVEDRAGEVAVDPNGNIAFRGNGSIFSFSPSNGLTTRLTADTVMAVEGPLFPRSGLYWTYTEYSEIPLKWRVVVVSPGLRTPLADYSEQSTWCDDQSLIYLNKDFFITNVRRMNSPLNLTQGKFLILGAPSCSPDGKRVAFAASLTEQTLSNGGRIPTPSAIYVMDTDGKNVHKVASGGNAQAPAWSADGHYLAFSTVTPTGSSFKVVDSQ